MYIVFILFALKINVLACWQLIGSCKKLIKNLGTFEIDNIRQRFPTDEVVNNTMTDIVYKFMKVQNRPYSINDIVCNLHNEYGKTSVQKAVDKLVAEGKVFEKVYGKQKVYCLVQDSNLDVHELMRIDKELQVHANEVESKYQQLDKEIKVQEALLLSIKSSITIEEARRRKNELKRNVTVLENKVDELMGASGTEDLAESRRKAEKALNEYSREYTKRKRLCTEIIDCILENYPGSKTELYEEIGIEPKIL